MHRNKKRRRNRRCNEGIPTRSPRWLLFLWPQQEEQQGPARHFIRVPEFEGQRVFHVFVLVGEVGVEEPQPVTPNPAPWAA
jgi:hypothetical protein